ncbi:tetratricopeptide repeat protein [uncultured Alistipes sp.]|uniref:tetratricopeptide repeat protein n=1 Tax=uncultured Alistipes sp. TaxID=538949 RepID=UPI0026130C16|nr:tetratricopeptide repeat protein [uncultured Alistipes sp.]
MKRTAAITVLTLLFATAFVSGRNVRPAGGTDDDTLRAFRLYTEGIKREAIDRDTLRAREAYAGAIEADTTFAAAYYALASLLLDTDTPQAVALSRRAAQLDSTEKWYLRLYGQALVTGGRYDEALGVYRTLSRIDSHNPEVYSVLAALYEQAQLPFSAIAVLDSAELRLGRIPPLTAAKRRLLVATRQYDKAVTEAEALVAAAPYQIENRMILGELYGMQGRDSLAVEQFDAALRIDSTDVAALVAVAEFHNRRRNYRAFLRLTRRLFESDAITPELKAEQFERMTSDVRFYREHYFQLNELASVLAIKYPDDPRIVGLYGRHLIAAGELDRALELFKLHTADRPPVSDYFTMVIDIESYRQRPDSADKYAGEALRLFPQKPEFHIARGHIRSYAGRHDEAVRSYRAALRHIGTDSLRGVVWGCIGDTYHAAGERRKSYAAYDRALRYDPDNTMVLNNYAYFLALEERDLERALRMAERAVEHSANNPTFLDTQAWILHLMGRTADARRTMQLAISLDRSGSPELMIHYGDILAAAGERYMAEVYWRKALENGYADPEAVARRFEWLRTPRTEETEKTSGQ